jgi:uncharacterized protein with HEPN domain
VTEDERSIDHLEQMLEHATLGLSFVEGLDIAAFRQDQMAQHALAMVLINIGEVTTKILRRNRKLVEDNPQMPWHLIIGMRNRIAHDYHSVDIDVVWQVAQDSLRDLLREIPPILKPLIDKYGSAPTSMTPRS